MSLHIEEIDGFDHYATADGSLYNALFQGTIVSGRTGNCWHSTGNAQKLNKSVPAHATFQCGFAFKLGAHSSASWSELIRFRSTTTAQVEILVSTSGHISISRNGTGLVTISTSSIQAGIWYWIEFKCYIHDSSGAAEVRINGQTWCSGSSLDTKNGTPTTVDNVLFGNDANEILEIDDFYYGYLDAYADDAWLGDLKIETLYPTGIGTTTTWTPSTGNNWECVNDPTPNTSDYITSSGVGNVDTYQTGDLVSTVGAVYGVKLMYYAKKDDVGARSIKGVVRTAGGDHDQAEKGLSTSWAAYGDIIQSNPDGGSWTIATVNSIEIGVKDFA